jgi:hypothetical protein
MHKKLLTSVAFFFVFAFCLYHAAEWSVASGSADPTDARNLVAACFISYAISALLLIVHFFKC